MKITDVGVGFKKLHIKWTEEFGKTLESMKSVEEVLQEAANSFRVAASKIAEAFSSKRIDDPNAWYNNG